MFRKLFGSSSFALPAPLYILTISKSNISRLALNTYLLMVIIAMNSNDKPTLAYCKNGIKLQSNVPRLNMGMPKNLIALNGRTTAQNRPSATHKLKKKMLLFHKFFFGNIGAPKGSASRSVAMNFVQWASLSPIVSHLPLVPFLLPPIFLT